MPEQSVVFREEPVFPPEIFKEIIDHLADLFSPIEDTNLRVKATKKEMQVIALVSKVFLSIARAFLFQEIYFNVRQTLPLGSIANFFAKNERVAWVVNRVDLLFHNQYFANEERITSLFELPNVEILSISQNIFFKLEKEAYESSSSDISTYGLRSFLEHYLQSGKRLNTLRVSYLDHLPFTKILSSPTLQSLHLSKCNLSTPFHQVPSSESGLTSITIDGGVIHVSILANFRRLEKLYLSSEYVMTNNLIPTNVPIFPSLKYLFKMFPPDFGFEEESMEPEELTDIKFITDNSPNLTCLSLQYQDLGYAPPVALSPSLVDLALEWRGAACHPFNKASHRAPIEALSSFKHPSLKTLGLKLTVLIFGDAVVDQSVVFANLLDTFGDIVSLAMDTDSTRFPSLDSLSIAILIRRQTSSEDEIWDCGSLKGSLEQHIQRLNTTDRYKFRSQVGVERITEVER
ncbi:hypothetical protein CVT24_003553 [Panaeolus cyanescens]|uniref:F-box domain-containing protein n=1 Tax=Panaeolus cyanescens TaxID=181874 RepID=A0A409WN39_9AGAR|nr:hypothetical protein CVT24_003553 [Panaeolus cyanescens]